MNVKACMKHHVVWVKTTDTVRKAAALFVQRHIGFLPVVDEKERLVGALGLRDLLDLTLPAFVRLIDDIDFVHDFGAVENYQPPGATLAEPVSLHMRPAFSVHEDCGLLRAYAMILQYDIQDLPIVDADGTLTGLASRVDIGTAILAGWSNSEGGP